MSNRLAIVLGVILIALIAYDIWASDSENLIFLGKKLLDLIEWMAFWR